ncbi:MAG: DUF418 domain-containing protein [Phycisphaerales bacterium]|nr:MAG: DUF418 domain-containing protein [Phycisphaerales bacterium]
MSRAVTGAGPMTAAPVLAGERESSIDVLRGFALLGILVVNIQMFAFPMLFPENPGALIDYTDAWNRAGVWITNLFAFGKMMFLFSLLFGAGVIFYARKFESGGLGAGAGLWYRRMAWLLLIGLIHAVFIWYGDILVWYAVVGMTFIWWVRKWPARALIPLGVGLMVLGASATVLIMSGLQALETMNQNTAEPMAQPMYDPTDPAHEIGVFQGGYLGIVFHRLIMLSFMYLIAVPFMYGPFIGGVMCLGMGLVKNGFLTGKWRTGTYFAFGVGGLGLGAGIAGLVLARAEADEFASGGLVSVLTPLVTGPLGGLGWAGLLLGLWKLGALGPVGVALGAVGRMALSNYLLTSIICTTIFYGYGFGYYAELEYPALFVVVLGVWAVCVVFSLVWLRVLKLPFGPAEWAWRTLTYGRIVRAGGATLPARETPPAG